MRARLLAALLLFAAAAPAGATVMVTVHGPAAALAPGEIFTLELRAVASLPILGFGLDLAFDPSLLALADPPAIGPDWVPLVAPDGDGLAGAAFPSGLSGDLLLATLSFQALAPGVAVVAASFTADDLTEGFPLDPSGFDADVSFADAVVAISVPEPGAASVLLAGLAGLTGLAGRRGARARKAGSRVMRRSSATRRSGSSRASSGAKAELAHWIFSPCSEGSRPAPCYRGPGRRPKAA